MIAGTLVSCFDTLSQVNVIRLCPSLSVTQVAWRPPKTGFLASRSSNDGDDDADVELAVASEDSSLRIIKVGSAAICSSSNDSAKINSQT